MNSPSIDLDKFQSLVGNLARPLVLLAIGFATAWAIVKDFAPATIGAAGLIAGAMYGVRSAENYGAARQDARTKTAQANASATVEVAKAQAAPPTS